MSQSNEEAISSPPDCSSVSVSNGRRGNTLYSLQAGRAFAAIAVLLHHAALAGGTFGEPFKGQWLLEQGYLGVDFFFVLSGFIITHATVGRGRTVRDYALARIIRVYGPYLPVGIAIALVYTFLPSVGAPQHDWSWLPTLTLAPVQSAPALSVAWTLQFEILFYLIFGLAHFTGLLRPVLFFWAVAIGIGWATGHSDWKLLAPINAEFLMGVLVCCLAKREFGSPWLLPISVIPIWIWVTLGADRSLSVLVGLSLALAMLVVVRWDMNGRLKVAEWTKFWGDASYSLYLVHGFAISIVMRLIMPRDATTIVLTAVAAGLIGGLVYFLVVERPIRRLLQGVASRKRSRS